MYGNDLIATQGLVHDFDFPALQNEEFESEFASGKQCLPGLKVLAVANASSASI